MSQASYDFCKIVLEPLGISLQNLKSAVIFLEACQLPMVHCKYLLKQPEGEMDEITKKFRLQPIDEDGAEPEVKDGL